MGSPVKMKPESQEICAVFTCKCSDSVRYIFALYLRYVHAREEWFVQLLKRLGDRRRAGALLHIMVKNDHERISTFTNECDRRKAP